MPVALLPAVVGQEAAEVPVGHAWWWALVVATCLWLCSPLQATASPYLERLCELTTGAGQADERTRVASLTRSRTTNSRIGSRIREIQSHSCESPVHRLCFISTACQSGHCVHDTLPGLI